MKKFWAAICTVVMLGITISVSGVQNPNLGDIDGDTNGNPWEGLFTTVPTTTLVETTTEETTLVETSTEEATPVETITDVQTTPEISTLDINITSEESTSETTSELLTEEKTTDIVPSTNKTTQSTVNNLKLGKVKIRKASKKSSKVYIKFKKIKGAKKYEIQISTSNKFKKSLIKKTVKKTNIKFSTKKLKNKKRLYVRVRAVKIVKNKAYKGKWSVKRIKIKRK